MLVHLSSIVLSLLDPSFPGVPGVPGFPSVPGASRGPGAPCFPDVPSKLINLNQSTPSLRGLGGLSHQ